ESNQVSDLHGLLQMEGQPGEEIAESVLESQTDDGGQDGGADQEATELHVRQQHLKDDRDTDSENEESRQLPQKSGSRGRASQAGRDIGEEGIGHARDGQGGGGGGGGRGAGG